MSREDDVRTVANTIAAVALRFNMTGKQPSDLYHAIAEHLADAQLLQSPETAAETELLRARVAELEAERHSTNEALDDAAKALREQRDRIAELEAAQSRDALTRTYAPVAALREDVTPQVQRLRSLLAGQRAALEGEHYAAVHHDYRVPRDLPPAGGAS